MDVRVHSLVFLACCFIFLGGGACHMACGVLVPHGGTEPMPSAVKAWSPDHWATRDVPALFLYICYKRLNTVETWPES